MGSDEDAVSLALLHLRTSAPKRRANPQGKQADHRRGALVASLSVVADVQGLKPTPTLSDLNQTIVEKTTVPGQGLK